MRTIAKTVKVSCDALLYETEGGDKAPLRVGQWVEFKRKITPGNMRQMLGFASGATGDYTALAEGLDAITELLARKIVAWNWTDLEADNAQLPPPTLEVLRELDFNDLLNLINLYVESVFPSKN